MQRGWVSLYRKLTDSEIYPDPFLLKLWIHCLFKASHSEREQMVGRQIVKLEPGQFITGRDALAKEYNAGATKKNTVSAITLWRWLLLFEELEMLNIKKTTKYSVVTVIHWNEYQKNEQQTNDNNNVSNLNENVTDFCSKSEQQIHGENVDSTSINKDSLPKNEQQMNNKRTTNEQQMNTNNNLNNLNKNNISIQQAEQFSSWWDLYNKKYGKAKCEPKFKALVKEYGYEVIEEGTKRYLEYLRVNNINKQFQKYPLTFLNGEHFMDEYEQTSTPALETRPTESIVLAKISYEED